MMTNNYAAWPHNAAEAAAGWPARRPDRLESAAVLAVMRGEDPCAAMAQQIADNKRAEILEAALSGERTINLVRMRQAAKQFRDVLDTLGVDVRDILAASEDDGSEGVSGNGGGDDGPGAGEM